MSREIVQAHEIRQLRAELKALTTKATHQERLLAAIVCHYAEDNMFTVSKHEMRINYEVYTGTTNGGDTFHVRSKPVNPQLF